MLKEGSVLNSRFSWSWLRGAPSLFHSALSTLVSCKYSVAFRLSFFPCFVLSPPFFSLPSLASCSVSVEVFFCIAHAFFVCALQMGAMTVTNRHGEQIAEHLYTNISRYVKYRQRYDKRKIRYSLADSGAVALIRETQTKYWDKGKSSDQGHLWSDNEYL